MPCCSVALMHISLEVPTGSAAVAHAKASCRAARSRLPAIVDAATPLHRSQLWRRSMAKERSLLLQVAVPRRTRGAIPLAVTEAQPRKAQVVQINWVYIPRYICAL